MSYTDMGFHHERILIILTDLFLYNKIKLDYYFDKFEVSKKTLRKDIGLIRSFLLDEFNEDVYLVYNRKENQYELIIIKGKILSLDLPYNF